MAFVMNCSMINEYKMVIQDFFNTLYNHKEIKTLFICTMRLGVFRKIVKVILYSFPYMQSVRIKYRSMVCYKELVNVIFCTLAGIFHLVRKLQLVIRAIVHDTF